MEDDATPVWERGYREVEEDSEVYAPRGRAQLDPAAYWDMLDDLECTEAQKLELLKSLWHITGMVAAMGWQLDAVGLVFTQAAEKSRQSAKALRGTQPDAKTKEGTNNKAKEETHD